MITLLKDDILLNLLFLCNNRLSFRKIEKTSNVQKEISQTIDKYDKESVSTQSIMGQIAPIQSKVFERAIKLMGNAFEDMDIEIEQKDKNLELLQNF